MPARRVSWVPGIFLLARHTGARATDIANCTSRVVLNTNMPLWVGKVPYSHFVNKTWGYPTDCSGFVSWALQTRALAVGRELKAFEYSADVFSTRIEIDALAHGDIITHVFDKYTGRCVKSAAAIPEHPTGLPDYLGGHVFFFDKLVDSQPLDPHFLGRYARTFEVAWSNRFLPWVVPKVQRFFFLLKRSCPSDL